MKEAAPSTVVLKDIGLNQVELTGAYHVNAFEKEMAYLTSYDADRLLVGFREVAGLPAKAKIYPGWENTEIRGHTLGHYLTACAQAYSQNQSAELLTKLAYIISELSVCQLESGYLSAFPETLFDNVENRKPAWVPWYTMHKIIAGLIDVYEGTRIQTAYDVVNKLGDWVSERTSRWSKELQATVLAVEYGGMNDCLYNLYKLTGNNRHLEAAHQFDELSLFEAIWEGKDILKGKHANTMIPKFVGALNRYLTLGESEVFYREAAAKFWDMVVYQHSYITGGNSENEHFGEPGLLDARRSDVTCETCNSYNMLKLTRELFKLTQDVKYADFYETTYVNAILSSQNPDNGMTMYFQPMATGYFKIYSSPFEHFWCCTGTGMESFTKLNDSIYFQRDQQLYVNQYLSSQLDWSEQKVKIIQTTDLPSADTVHLSVEMIDQQEQHLSIYLRVPYWAAGELAVAVNGKAVQPQVRNGYALIERVWKNGDTVQVQIPMKATYSSLPDAPNVVGFKYGPLVLSAALGTDDMVESRTGILVSVATKRMLVKDFIIPQGVSVQEWFDSFDQHFVRKESEFAFVLRNTDEDDHLVFTPHYKQHSERYGIYWKFIEAGSDDILRHLENSKQERLIREATIDSVQVGNDQYELEHQVKGELTHAGTWEGLNGRRAEAEGWFSYELKVLPGQKNGLSVTFNQWLRDKSLEVWIDGKLLITETSPNEGKRGFYEKIFEIPADMIASGRESFVVKFVPIGGLNGIYGILRSLKL
ncbi:glycoside hydrolase family 127 protein [Paenibacillus andongensis]|uniref:glycoside hydrolase family 127 protein n=1 Tax=Paenibacillus andongensis TaxID=2975482 RepID=UPI0021BA4D15|nr:glycoside hydrolase family 127 protein [Paenibacillus andongensis]